MNWFCICRPPLSKLQHNPPVSFGNISMLNEFDTVEGMQNDDTTEFFPRVLCCLRTCVNWYQQLEFFKKQTVLRIAEESYDWDEESDSVKQSTNISNTARDERAKKRKFLTERSTIDSCFGELESAMLRLHLKEQASWTRDARVGVLDSVTGSSIIKRPRKSV
jgi:hypothetical protein